MTPNTAMEEAKGLAERPTFNAGPRDWPEDEKYENGSYTCHCFTCGSNFTGLKRRITCKPCALAAIDASRAAGGETHHE
jgi:hypothetical protein